MSITSSGANAAYEFILAILFTGLSRVGNLSMSANVAFFEKLGAQTVDAGEAQVYRKFALALDGLVEAGPAGRHQTGFHAHPGRIGLRPATELGYDRASR